MPEITGIDRRRFLQLAGIGALATTAAPRWLFAASNGRYAREPSPGFDAQVEIEITATAAEVPILPGKPTRVWRYQGKLLKGPEGTVAQLPGTYLGSVISLEKGQRVRIYFKNDLPEPNIIHWHGLHVPQNMDGHPMYDVPPGSGYVYEFRVDNPAGTYMYHAHTHEKTGQHVYRGLAGLIIVSDPDERALNLPQGEHDVPIVLQDRSFDGDNQLRYVQSMRERHMGFLGDDMIVNGKRHFVLPVATRPYRLRLLNGSNSRIYKLGWHDGTPLTVIGTDGHLLGKPVTRRYIMLAPGERVELWADFSGRKIDTEMVMKSLAFTGAMPGHGEGRDAMMGGMMHGGRGMMGMMHGGASPTGREDAGEEDHGGMSMMGTSKLPLGSEYELFKVHIMREESVSLPLPQRLVHLERHQRAQAENDKNPRSIRISMMRMQWLLNGREFEMNAAAPEETVRMNTLQVIEFDNGYTQPGMGMGMMSGLPHPMHIHGQQFQIIERVIRDDRRKDYQTVNQGFVDDGWKDVVLVMPGEKVTLLKRFDDYKGLFLYHCHNLEHEEMGMMRNFNVV